MKKVHILFTFSRRRKQNTAPFASTPSWLQQRVISTVADSNIDHDPCSDIRLLNEKKLGLFTSTRQERHTSEHNRQRDLGTGRYVNDYTGVKHIGYLSVCRCLPPKSVHSHPLQYLLPTLRPGKGGLHEGFITWHQYIFILSEFSILSVQIYKCDCICWCTYLFRVYTCKCTRMRTASSHPCIRDFYRID